MNVDWTGNRQQWKTSATKLEERSVIESKINEEDEKFRAARRNIVSRISRPSDPEAQFIFCAPTYQNIPYVLGYFLLNFPHSISYYKEVSK